MMERLVSFAALQASGVDARNFLQGQLSNDVQQLSESHSLLASINSAQGRVQAVVLAVQRGEDIVLLIPAELTTGTLARLQRYVLRAKVKLTDAGQRLPLFAASAAALDAEHLPVPAAPGAVVHHANLTVLRWPSPDPRYLVIGEVASAAASADIDRRWRLADIGAGLPQVLPATHEAFVAQMLNLDLLNGISFDKGCYTGQEIIARTHFRGTIKRRMLRFAAACPPPPGARVLANGLHAGDVVMSAAIANGCEFLAVVSLQHLSDALELSDAPGAAPVRQSLPYDIPNAG